MAAPRSNPHLAAIARDIGRYFQLDLDVEPDAGAVSVWLSKLRLVLTTPGLHATLVFRYGHWAYGPTALPALWFPFKAVYRLLDLIYSLLLGVHIDVRAQVGGGLYVGHADGILIGPVKMGVDCTVGRQVTIGRRADGNANVPVIGDRVYIGISSVIFGGITIGDGVTIGPLTVIGRSLPPCVLVTGNPMKVLRAHYDNSVEIYGRPAAVRVPVAVAIARAVASSPNHQTNLSEGVL